MEGIGMIIIKFISLVIAIWFSIVNFGLLAHNQSVSTINLFIQALSIATFVFSQFKLF